VQSAKEARWEPGSGSLLDLAEARGMEPAFGCRSGSCGTCAAKIVAGAVTYLERPQAKVAPDMALVCCAIPVHTNDPGKNRLVLDL
jgi:ferredoxin